MSFLLLVPFGMILLLVFPFDTRPVKKITKDDILSLDLHQRRLVIYWPILLQHLEAVNPGYRIKENQATAVINEMIHRGQIKVCNFEKPQIELLESHSG